jgi:hypothetical protein
MHFLMTLCKTSSSLQLDEKPSELIQTQYRKLMGVWTWVWVHLSVHSVHAFPATLDFFC